MLSRMLFGLVLGLIMYMPRPTRPEGPPPGFPPGGPDDLPPGEDDPEILPIPMPDPDDRPRHIPGGFSPALPPTPPPGYEGEWPPASELPELPTKPGRPDVPPTPPPGHEGPWPGERRSLLDRIVDLLRELTPRDRGVLLADTRDGARHLATAAEGSEAPPPA